MYVYAGNNWSHRNRTRKFKEKNLKPYRENRKKFNRFTTTSAVLGTSHIKREALQYEIGSLRVGDRR
jgi:hypothetical protein